MNPERRRRQLRRQIKAGMISREQADSLLRAEHGRPFIDASDAGHIPEKDRGFVERAARLLFDPQETSRREAAREAAGDPSAMRKLGRVATGEGNEDDPLTAGDVFGELVPGALGMVAPVSGAVLRAPGGAAKAAEQIARGPGGIVRRTGRRAVEQIKDDPVGTATRAAGGVGLLELLRRLGG